MEANEIKINTFGSSAPGNCHGQIENANHQPYWELPAAQASNQRAGPFLGKEENLSDAHTFWPLTLTSVCGLERTAIIAGA